jgi:hypothetical protein
MCDTGYSITDLMVIVMSEGAERLILCPGDPPVIFLSGERHTVEGPPLTVLDTELIFRKLADTRHLRQLRGEMVAKFIYTFRSALFRVTARLWSTGVVLDMEREQAQQAE